MLPILLGLVGIEAAEFAQRLGKAVAGAEVAGDGQRVAGAELLYLPPIRPT